MAFSQSNWRFAPTWDGALLAPGYGDGLAFSQEAQSTEDQRAQPSLPLEESLANRLRVIATKLIFQVVAQKALHGASVEGPLMGVLFQQLHD